MRRGGEKLVCFVLGGDQSLRVLAKEGTSLPKESVQKQKNEEGAARRLCFLWLYSTVCPREHADDVPREGLRLIQYLLVLGAPHDDVETYAAKKYAKNLLLSTFSRSRRCDTARVLCVLCAVASLSRESQSAV
jgi:hypothetical protein